MGGYVFRMPASTPRLTFSRLKAITDNYGAGRIGKTVTIQESVRSLSGEGEHYILFQLYELPIARIFRDRVEFAGTDDPHMATTAWLGKIIRDNGIGAGVWRVRRFASDPEGPCVPRGHAGLLTIDGDRSRLVFGQAYPAGASCCYCGLSLIWSPEVKLWKGHEGWLYVNGREQYVQQGYDCPSHNAPGHHHHPQHAGN